MQSLPVNPTLQEQRPSWLHCYTVREREHMYIHGPSWLHCYTVRERKHMYIHGPSWLRERERERENTCTYMDQAGCIAIQ